MRVHPASYVQIGKGSSRNPSEPLVAMGVQRPWVLVHAERQLHAVEQRHLVHLGEQDVALGRGVQRRHQGAVVAPGVGAGDRAHGESAGPVRLEPLQPGRAGVVGANVARHPDRGRCAGAGKEE